MKHNDIILRAAVAADLAAINRLIDAAVMRWDLPERVKRLALPSYHYHEMDMQHYAVMVAILDKRIVGLIAWDKEPAVLDPAHRGLLLHGLYVDPDYWRRGIGTRLLQRARDAVVEAKLDGLLVKAQKTAEPFYQACGMVKLPVEDAQRDLERRYWLAVSA